MGIKDLKLQNTALLIRWLWKLYTARHSLWFRLTYSLYSSVRGCKSPLLWNKNGSFFWRDLQNLRFLLQISTETIVTDGQLTSFWFDNWGGKPLVNLLKNDFGYSRPRISLKDAKPILANLLPLPRKEHEHYLLMNFPPLTSTGNLPDSLSWRWNSNGAFSVASLYRILATAGKITSPFCSFWSFKVPPSLKFFLCLLSNNKLLTQQQLARRNIFVTPHCVFCHQQELEDSMHLFFTCPHSSQIWIKLRNAVHLPVLQPAGSLMDALTSLLQAVGVDRRRGTIVATCLWCMCLERNGRIFRGSQRSIEELTRWILEEANLYYRTC
ncbi:hypothetical protein LUZ63_014408 [Rhynchospora breviuscula]|uniref:Reverse transcriptase zinc-binding domain-containing protein n=1 Tax=Rhynchospora breviuscula TaxID=2022672 RepID=A0A9Q0HLK7_9POAL|nr:hypothetical protein LUZ63_014408 [Rhynchospora breviuscula]